MDSMPPILFDAAARHNHELRHASTRHAHDFLHREAGEMLLESLEAITHSFPHVAVIGHPSPALRAALAERPGTQDVVALADPLANERLELAENSVDAIVSNLDLYSVNDLPGMLVQVRRALKPDGLFLATLPGAESLMELRQVLAEAEVAINSGVSPRVAPFIDVREAGNLLSRAGFALPVTDSTTLPITYSSLFALMDELRGAGAANMLKGRKKSFTARGFFVHAAERYAAQHGDGEGRITATAEIITLTAWKPAPNQQQPAKRGSGTINFIDALKN